jgi:hypothetical protein
MSEIVNRIEDSWDAWLQAGEKEAAADPAAVDAGGGSPDAEQEDWSAAQPDAHQEADWYGGQREPGSADQAAETDNMGYTTTEEMMVDNMTSEDLPTSYWA